MSQLAQREIDKNYEFFVGYVPEILDKHRGDYALLREEKCVAIFPTLLEAVAEAVDRFKDGLYSIQEVTDSPVDLGFFSHANNPGDVR